MVRHAERWLGKARWGVEWQAMGPTGHDGGGLAMESITETPQAALARIVQPLDETRAATLRESFGAMFDAVDRWRIEASGLTVTAETETKKMGRARLLRLEIREARVTLDKRRKALKAGILIEGRALDGAYSVFEGLASPLESFLLEQEQFSARAEAARRDALHDARKAALSAHGVAPEGMPAVLGQLSDEAWSIILDDAKRAQESRAEQARLADEAKAEASRILAEKEAARRAEQVRLEAERVAREAEQRAENERLRAEAKVREEEQAAERARVAEERRAEKAKAEADAFHHAQLAAERDRLAREEREAAEAVLRAEQSAANDAREKAEAEAAQLRQAEEDRKAQEAETKKPTKAKYMAMVAVLKGIGARVVEPRAAAEARAVLRDVGEWVDATVEEAS